MSPRPRRRRNLQSIPNATFYKPQGIPLHALEVVTLTHEEWEALRLKFTEGCDQHASAEQMGTSQSTFQRILFSAQKKTSEALVCGKALRIMVNKEN
jgi:predicted DNA-binding protein (UPF0251 family)